MLPLKVNKVVQIPTPPQSYEKISDIYFQCPVSIPICISIQIPAIYHTTPIFLLHCSVILYIFVCSLCSIVTACALFTYLFYCAIWF